MSKIHEHYMRLAMKEALKAKGKTSPNPMVGALVVKQNKIISRGYHKRAGLAHAEVVALDKAKGKAKGATLYVTLEPCTHYGRTGPCTDKIIQSGIKKVIIGMADPNPINNRKGIKILKRHGIGVEFGFLEEELKKINQVFIKYITEKMPLVTVKVAQSLDGKIATYKGDSKWISSYASRKWVHQRRSDYDAIMVGVNTLLKDNPKLQAWDSDQHPVKVIIDSQLRIPKRAKIFSKISPVIIVTLPCTSKQKLEKKKILSTRARVIEVKVKSGQVDLKDTLKKLAQLEITNLIVEGGGRLIGSLFDKRLVDKVQFFISPQIIGGEKAISSVMGKGAPYIGKAIKLKDVNISKIDQDFLVEAYV